MKHGIRFWQKRFGLKPQHRIDFTKNMLTNLVLQEQIKTTVAKAKFLKHEMESWIEKAKSNDLKVLEEAKDAFGGEIAPKKLFSTLAERYQNRKGGYCRIVRAGNHRPGTDRAPVAFLELVGNPKDLVQSEALMHGQTYVKQLRAVESVKYRRQQIPLFVSENGETKTQIFEKLIPRQDLKLPDLKKLTIKEISLHKKLNKFDKSFPVIDGKKTVTVQPKSPLTSPIQDSSQSALSSSS